jgi:hypothetical protein
MSYIPVPYIRLGIGFFILILVILFIYYVKKWKVEMSPKDYLGFFFCFPLM